MADITIVFPKPGTKLYLPGGVHGFDGGDDLGVPMPTAHATPLLAAGHLETVEQRKARRDMEKAKAEQAAAATAEPGAA